MSELFDLMKKYDSIKVRNKYPYSHFYAKTIYPRYLEARRNEALKVLEVGIAYGGALQAMRDYLPNSQIIGYDLDLEQCRIEDSTRITLMQGSQDDRTKLRELVNAFGPFDMVIDDACHLFNPQRVSLEELWPAVKPGGLYFIEDVFTLAGKRGNASSQIFHHLKETWLTEDKFAKKNFIDFNKDVAAMTFYPTLIVIEKTHDAYI